jgi:uncharacterized protein involved in outer membrane biogenesis
MSWASRIALFAAIGLVGLVLVVAVALLGLVDANFYKTRLEASVSSALGMEVSIAGRLGIDFFPGLLLTLEDVHFRNQAADVVSAKEATIAVDLMSLLAKELRIENIVLKHPVISIERDRDGRFNLESTREAADTLPAVNWPNVSASDGFDRFCGPTIRQSIRGSGLPPGGASSATFGRATREPGQKHFFRCASQLRAGPQRRLHRV